MNITWRGSPNKDGPEYRKPITTVVIHWLGVGTLDAAHNRFQNPDAGVSAHYGISDDTVYQWVKEEHVAWHAGVYEVNQCSIGIEHDATTTKNASEKTYITSGKLVADICKRHNIPIDREHIIGHKEITSTQCPGTIDIDKIINLAKGTMNFLNEDIPTEVEDKFNLKSIKRYNKHWTYEDILSDWVNLTDEAKKQASKIKALEKLHEEITNSLNKQVKSLESKVGALEATTDNQLQKINQLAEFEEKYKNAIKKYDELSGEHSHLLNEFHNLEAEIALNYEKKIADLERRILQLQRPVPKLSEAIKLCIEAFKREVLGL